ncbi:MAG: hypothetical protein P8Q45_06420 [Candidatus Thalassarchaeaceae archaeon]|nr:hypothetical protein [Candidatus Thalassarchaeaceae archaeon]
MSMRSADFGRFGEQKAVLAVTCLLLLSISPMMYASDNGSQSLTQLDESKAFTGIIEPWSDGEQPWPQPGRLAQRTSVGPAHSPDGGAGSGSPADAVELASVVDPVVNWVYGSYSIGTDALGTPVADLSGQIDTEDAAAERCGGDSLFTIIIQTVAVGGNDHSVMRIVEGEDADLAWEVDLGATEIVKASPVVVDLDDDGSQEVIVVYDAAGTMYVDAYSPQLQCSVTGWSSGGSKSGELLWTYSDDSLRISSSEGPYTSSLFGGHNPTTQPLLADLDLDGDAELVLAAIDEISDNPVVVALPLAANGAPTPIWESTLQDGSHPSDPAFAQVDDETGYVLLTTTLASSGAMWVWKLDSETGDQKWGGLSLSNLDGDSDVPHIRLPGPIVANLDSDSTPEMIITIPTDADGSSSVDGAEYRGLEIDDGSEIWSFEAVNGYADAPPLAVDTDDDDVIDRVCWVSWYQETTARHGHAGCHDVSGNNPQLDWHHDLEQSSGAPNDEIAVAQPVWMDIDGNGAPELLVAYGRTLWAWDGDTGTQAAINDNWNDEVEVNHRTWSSPALADIDGDATLDIILGDTVVSTAVADVRPLLDGRAIEFNPSAPNPGEEVTVTAFFENAGTAEVDRAVDAILYADGVEIARHRADTLEPTDPTGSAGFESFSVDWSGALGEYEFELVLDPYQNVTQSRYDNDEQVTSLTIVPPYNATFEMPTNPVRVNPGDSTLSQPTVRSTGRLAGIWSLNVDASALPQGWTWSDETPGGISSIEIGTDATWMPSLWIHAPTNAAGSDAGYLSLTLTLDEDTNVSASGVLPVEANRTRGLSIRGPSGTTGSTGYGLIGDSAKAWLIVENLGNADENSISMFWDSTAWDSAENSLALYDEDGNEIPALRLNAGEQRIVTARLGVPSDAGLADSVSTPLTMCVGSGEEETCQTVQLEFIASGTITETAHQLSMPESTLEWTVTADLPASNGILDWKISEAGMGIENWLWSASGALSISGDDITLSGIPGSRVSGTLSLELPVDSPPAYHAFSDASSLGADHSLRLSVEVLQIYRASLTLISPTDSPHMVEVEEAIPTTVRLYNPGNGEDTYTMSHTLILDDNLAEDPGVQVTFSSEEITLSAGSLRTLPVEVVLPDTTPARTPVNIEITMTSEGDSSISSTITLTLEARQDHRWEIELSAQETSVEDRTFAVNPGDSFIVEISATNIGNLHDDIEIAASGIITPEGTDTATDWVIVGDAETSVAVNASTYLELIIEVPEGAWNGTTYEVSGTATAFDVEVASFSFTIEVAHVAGWTAVAADADLEIDPSGSTVSLSIIQQGNAPTRPYASVYVTGETGWVVEAPENLPTLEPGNTAPLDLEITPPETARHGRTVELHIKLREGDGSSEATITLPLRVAVIHEFSLVGLGNWIVSNDGGYPHAELQNLGNAPTTISLEVLSLPQGWTVSGRTHVVIGVGEVTGVPLEVIPDSEWDGSSRTIRILAQDEAGNQREISLDTQYEDHSWASSPIIVAVEGDSALLGIHGTSPASEVMDDAQFNLDWDLQGGWVWQAVSNGVGTQLTVDSDSVLPYSAYVIEPSSRFATCTIDGSAVSVDAECQVGNGTESFAFTVMLIDDEGSMLDSHDGFVAANTTSDQINLSASTWNPSPGMRTLTIRLLDERGALVASAERDFEIRRTDWNVGLVGLEIEGEGASQKIKVLTKREYHHLLTDADCSIEVTAGSHSAIHSIDVTGIYPPEPKLDRPDVEDGTEMIVTIQCLFPWDEDSDSSDDEARLILSGGSIESGDGFEWGTALGSAGLVIVLALTLTWILYNQRERRKLLEMTESVIQKKSKRKTPELPEVPPPVAEPSVAAPPPVIETTEEVPEIEERNLDEFENRFKRLTGGE